MKAIYVSLIKYLDYTTKIHKDNNIFLCPNSLHTFQHSIYDLFAFQVLKGTDWVFFDSCGKHVDLALTIAILLRLSRGEKR